MRKRILVPALTAGTLLAAGAVRTAVELRERHQQKRTFTLEFQHRAAATAGYIWGWHEAVEANTLAGETLKGQARHQATSLAVHTGNFGCYGTATFNPASKVVHFEINGDTDSLHVLRDALIRNEDRYVFVNLRETEYTTLFFNVAPERDVPAKPRLHTQPAKPHDVPGARSQT